MSWRETFKQLLGHFWVALQLQFIYQLHMPYCLRWRVSAGARVYLGFIFHFTIKFHYCGCKFHFTFTPTATFHSTRHWCVLFHFSDELAWLGDKKSFSNNKVIHKAHTHTIQCNFVCRNRAKETRAAYRYRFYAYIHTRRCITALISAKLANRILSQSFRRNLLYYTYKLNILIVLRTHSLPPVHHPI